MYVCKIVLKIQKERMSNTILQKVETPANAEMIIRDSIAERVLINVNEVTKSNRKIFKQIFDWTVALFALVLFSPFFLITSIVILLTSGKPLFYKQERIGKFGKPFMIYKFRTMIVGAEENGPQLSVGTDPRVTKVGRFLRRWKIDEVPNLLNVLRGEMSLVGPRPERKFYINQIVVKAPEYLELLQYKPGVTSMGEVEFGYAVTVDEMIERMKYDLKYQRNRNSIRDIILLLKSIIIILKGKGF
jgi:lipopolysaccharide/colanic/teichoic acid biosynthesis glycosyltransferase